MRDIGAIVWVILVVIGVISSIVSNARRMRQSQSQSQSPATRQTPQQPALRQSPQATFRRPPEVVVGSIAQQAAQPMRQAMPQPVVATRAPAVQQAAVTRRPAPHSVEAHAVGASFPQPSHAVSRHDVLGLRHRKSLVRAVIAAEVLGTPLALRDRI